MFELEDSYEPGRLYLEFLSPHDVYDKVVVVDAGHGGHAPGAVRLGISEKNIDLAILKQVKKLFDDGPDNIGVYYTRTQQFRLHREFYEYKRYAGDVQRI